MTPARRVVLTSHHALSFLELECAQRTKPRQTVHYVFTHSVNCPRAKVTGKVVSQVVRWCNVKGYVCLA